MPRATLPRQTFRPDIPGMSQEALPQDSESRLCHCDKMLEIHSSQGRFCSHFQRVQPTVAWQSCFRTVATEDTTVESVEACSHHDSQEARKGQSKEAPPASAAGAHASAAGTPCFYSRCPCFCGRCSFFCGRCPMLLQQVPHASAAGAPCFCGRYPTLLQQLPILLQQVPHASVAGGFDC